MPTVLILLGLALMIGMQAVIFAFALVKDPNKAALCLVIPFFVYIYAKNKPEARPFLWAWYIGVALLAVGVVAAS